MKAIVTVIGKDRVGITAAVCALLAQHNINILDISQTVLQDYFTMVMLVDTAACTASIGEMAALLEPLKGWRQVGESVTVRSAAHAPQLAAIEGLAAALIADISGEKQ